MQRTTVSALLIALAFAMPAINAEALPLHRIGVNWKTARKKVITVSKQLSAQQGAAWIASRARFIAAKTKTIGWCFKAVKGALKPFGIHLEGEAAWMAKEQLLSDERFTVTSLEDLQPGDILVHDRSKDHPYGHIAVYLGNETEASDHLQPLVDSSVYGGTTVFRLIAPISFLSIVREHSTSV